MNYLIIFGDQKTSLSIQQIIMTFKSRLFLIVLSALVVFASCNKDRNETTNKDIQKPLQDAVDSIYLEFNNKWGIEKSGVFVYITGPSGDFLASSNITPQITSATHFRVASISKTFTAAAIMLLHQEGKLSIDDTISKYLPEIPIYNIPNKNAITIKQLLQHRGGVFDITNNIMPETIDAPYAGMNYVEYVRNQDNLHTFTFDEIVGLNAEHQLSTAFPGIGFNYSNTGYNILGIIIETISGITYSDFITQKFITPLGLKNTYSVWQGNDIKIKSPFLESHLYIEGQPTLNTTEDNMSVHVTEGNIVSTPADITNWIRLLLTGEAGVDPANVELMKQMVPADEAHGLYGLGLVFNDGLGFGHDGAHVSYVSTLRYNPENGITVLASANFIRIDPEEPVMSSFYELAFSIRDACSIAAGIYLK